MPDRAMNPVSYSPIGANYGYVPPPPNLLAPSRVPQGTAATGNTGTPNVPTLPNYSQIDPLIQQINAANQQAQHAANIGRIPGAAQLEQQSSQDIAALLNPPTQFGEIDVPAAARAVSSGTVGSPFAGVSGLNLSEQERIRREQIGQQMLSGAYARNPAAPIADPQSFAHLLTQEGFQAQQAALDRELQAQIALLRTQGGYHPSVPSNSRYGPRLPATTPTSSTNIPPEAGGGATVGPGTGTLFSIPQDAIPDNWNQLTFEQQAQYAAQLAANPYQGVPDYANPYANEYDPDLAYQYMATEYPGYSPEMGYQTTP